MYSFPRLPTPHPDILLWCHLRKFGDWTLQLSRPSNLSSLPASYSMIGHMSRKASPCMVNSEWWIVPEKTGNLPIPYVSISYCRKSGQLEVE